MFSLMQQLVPRSAWQAGLMAAAVALAGCATKPKPAPAVVRAPAQAPAIQSLQQYLQEAAQAVANGNNKERARELYRSAARAYPSSKEPWAKLAEDYFDTSNYGQAILSAQEVLQRDPADAMATSILAVSGLRVSVAALASLHEQKAKLSGGPRTEAEQLAKQLRESLGETELVPQPAPAAVDAARPLPRARPVPVRRPQAAASAGAASATADPAPPADPFSILKK